MMKDRRESLPAATTLDEYVMSILDMWPTGSSTHRETWAVCEYIKQLSETNDNLHNEIEELKLKNRQMEYEVQQFEKLRDALLDRM